MNLAKIPYMKITALTIGQRVALGFALLLILAAGLGGFAVWQMLTATHGARFLAGAVAPQSSVASSLAQASSRLQRAIRTYSFTGEASELAVAKKNLADVNTSLVEARKLSAAHPELAELRESIGDAEKAIAAYAGRLEGTVANLQSLEQVRNRLDAAAAAVVADINAFIAAQDKKMAEEIAAGLPADKLEERRSKSEQANKIIDTINAIRIATFKAQALRQPALAEKALGLFDTIEAIRLKLVARTVQEVNLKQLATVGEAASAYKAGIEAMVKTFAESGVTDAARRDAANTFDGIVENVLKRSIQSTLDYAERSAASLMARSSKQARYTRNARNVMSPLLRA